MSVPVPLPEAPPIVVSDLPPEDRAPLTGPSNAPLPTEGDVLTVGQVLDRLRARLSQPTCIVGPNNTRWRHKYAGYPQHFADEVQATLPRMLVVLDELETHKLPAEFAVIPIVESWYRPDVHSFGGAAGMWQFLAETARNNGATVNGGYDGRLSMLDATDAAMNYLDKLQAMFNDWRLTAMAYNSGEYRLAKTMAPDELAARSAGGALHYRRPGGLSNTTYEYVSKMRALVCMLAQPQRQEIPFDTSAPITHWVRYTVPADIDSLDDLAQRLGTDAEELKAFNRGYRNGRIEADAPRTLLVPAATRSRWGTPRPTQPAATTAAASAPGNATSTTPAPAAPVARPTAGAGTFHAPVPGATTGPAATALVGLHDTPASGATQPTSPLAAGAQGRQPVPNTPREPAVATVGVSSTSARPAPSQVTGTPPTAAAVPPAAQQAAAAPVVALPLPKNAPPSSPKPASATTATGASATGVSKTATDASATNASTTTAGAPAANTSTTAAGASATKAARTIATVPSAPPAAAVAGDHAPSPGAASPSTSLPVTPAKPLVASPGPSAPAPVAAQAARPGQGSNEVPAPLAPSAPSLPPELPAAVPQGPKPALASASGTALPAPATPGAAAAQAPVSASAPSPTSLPTGTPRTYKVQFDDSLATIAQRFGFKVEDLRTWNHLAIDATLYVDQVLKLEP